MPGFPPSAESKEGCVRLHRVSPSRESLSSFCFDVLPEGSFRKILIKPNWVKHQEDPSFPIAALVTSTDLIAAVIDACIRKYPGAEEIVVGDVPLQSCDWERLMAQSGVEMLSRKYASLSRPRVRFLDLRREVYVAGKRLDAASAKAAFGDPNGYREVRLDKTSFLDPISEANQKFRVADYSPQETVSSHKRGFHRYLIAASALRCDLFINLPKLKVHQKAGVTGALKNLVGINGQKAYLVHYRAGLARQRGDEFPDQISPLVRLQSWLRQSLQERSRTLFRLLRLGWLPLKRLARIETRGTRENLSRNFYISGGAWYGNDTIWRMVYDLNRIIRYADAGGTLKPVPQREYVAIMDGIIAGEGNGPLQPLAVELGVVLAADDPFKMDMAMARLIGFDYRRIPTLSHHQDFGDPGWGNFRAEELLIEIDGQMMYLEELPVLQQFLPPPGWRGHIELEGLDAERCSPAQRIL